MIIKKFTNNSLIILSIMTLLGLNTANAQVGIGTTSPDASAQLELQSTAKGFLPPRMDTDARNNINSPAEGLLIYNTNSKELEFFNGTSWLNFDGTVLATPIPTITSGACSGEPEFLTFEGLEYRPVESGVKCWLDRNLGATQVAGNITDANAYGDLYQWGRAADGHEDRTIICPTDCYDGNTSILPVNATDAGAWDGLFIKRDDGSSGVNNWLSNNPDNNDLWQGVNGTNNPCPSGYRIPTKAEWNVELQAWGAGNYSSSAFNSELKLLRAGSRKRDGDFYGEGSVGLYWSSSTTNDFKSGYLYFNNTSNFTLDAYRVLAYSVRCIKE